MMNTIILDSSDDEADNFDWISKLLYDVPDPNPTLAVADDDDNDSDDVVVVGEFLAKPKRAKVSRLDEEDDDCVVLDCDPDKPAKKVLGSEVGVGEGKVDDEDSDDLVIVGEKGQAKRIRASLHAHASNHRERLHLGALVACRDYPHSRHLCAKFPFGSTPSGSHCDLCHCYVCDSLAPCAYWGSGDSDLDHCCATDKVDHWKNERKLMRESKNPSPAIPKPAGDSLPRLPQTILRPASTCGVSSSFGAPNIISHNRSQRPVATITRNRFQTQQVRQLLRACNVPAQSNRSLRAPPGLVTSHPAFKRSVYTGRTRVVSPSTYIQPKDTMSSCWQLLLNQPSVGKSAEFNSVNLTESSPHLGGAILSSSQPLVCNISTATLPSHMQSYNNSVAQTPTSTFQVYGQSTVATSTTIGATDNPWAYSSGSLAQNSSWPVIPCNTANAVDSVKLSSQVEQNVSGRTVSGNTSGGFSGIAPSIHHPSETANGFSHSAYPFNTSNSMENMGQSFQQQSVEKPQGEDSVPVVGNNSLLPSVEHENPPMSGCMNSSPLEFDFNSWLPENDSLLGGQYGSDLFNVSNDSSVPPVDAGMLLFDFETSWNGLTHS